MNQTHINFDETIAQRLGEEGITPRARKTDPTTSHEAAASMVTTAQRHQAAILAVLQSGEPLAAEQIGDRLGMSHVAVNRRLSELERGGRVTPTAQRHRNRSGRMAVKYMVRPR